VDACEIAETFQGWHLEKPPKRRTLTPRLDLPLSHGSLRSGLCPGNVSRSHASTAADAAGGGAMGDAEDRTPDQLVAPAVSRSAANEPTRRKRRLFEELPSMLRSMESDLNAMNIVEAARCREAKLSRVSEAGGREAITHVLTNADAP